MELLKKPTSEPLSVVKQLEKTYREKTDAIKEKMHRVDEYSECIRNNLNTVYGKQKKKRRQPAVKLQQTQHTCLTDEYNQHMMDRYNNKARINSTDSSWQDLTDCSTTNATEWGSGDKELVEEHYLNENVHRLKDFYELKISNLLSIIEEIKEENVLLKDTVEGKNKEIQKSKPSNFCLKFICIIS